MRKLILFFTGLFFFASVLSPSAFAQANSYAQKNLVTDPSGQGPVKDSNLTNPWGICIIPGDPFWIADNNSGVTSLYDKTGAMMGSFPVAPPAGSSNPGTPTGCVGNTGNTGFNVTAPGTASAFSLFIFASEDGTISGWNGMGASPTPTIVAVDNSQNPTAANGAVYKGLALLTNKTGTFLLATNFRAAKVEAYDTSFAPANAQFSGNFVDTNPPAVPAGVNSNGYAPFGIHIVNNQIFVTYALQDSSTVASPTGINHDPIKMAGTGYVDIFDPNTGAMIQRIADSHMNAPWGVVIPPTSFGSFGASANLLVGNFGDGTINAYTFPGGAFVGQMKDGTGAVITNSGLWDMVFDASGQTGTAGTMYFTAGGATETTGVFATMTPNPATPAATPDFKISGTPATQTITAGQRATFTVTLTSLNGFNSAVSLSCSGQQIGSTCTLSPTSATPSANGTVTSMATIATNANPYSTASLSIPDLNSRLLAMLLPVPGLGFLGLLAAGSARKQRLIGQGWPPRLTRSILLLLVTISFLTASGCYNKKTGSGTQRSTNTITIMGTSGSLSHTTTVTLTVQ
jgi:uncharacterized protein (TIGR03118 family)